MRDQALPDLGRRHLGGGLRIEVVKPTFMRDGAGITKVFFDRDLHFMVTHMLPLVLPPGQFLTHPCAAPSPSISSNLPTADKKLPLYK